MKINGIVKAVIIIPTKGKTYGKKKMNSGNLNT